MIKEFIEKDIAKYAANIINEFAQFTNGIRVMMLINRGIQNSNKGSKRWVNKLISYDSKTFEENLLKLLHLQYYLDDNDNRLYLSVNPRKIKSAIRYFQHKQIDLITEEENLAFYINIQNNFCSALMNPANRDGNFFLLDNDEKYSWATLNFYLQSKNIKIIKTYLTPNGSHHICEPFNPSLIEGVEKVEIKKDALILLNYI